MSEDSGVIVHLNAIGRQVLESFLTGLSIDELAEAIAAGYGISHAQARADLVQFRDDLEQSVYDAQRQAPRQHVEASALTTPVTHANYKLFGRMVHIAYPDQQSAAICHPPLAPFACDPGAPNDLNVEISVTAEDVVVRCAKATVSIPNIPGALLTALPRALLCHDTPNPGTFGVVLHAGAVVGSQGAWLIGGASGRGKTTLVARLDAAGFRVLSDDLVPVDLGKGDAYPMPTALSLKEKGWSAISQFREDLTAAPICTSPVGKRVKYLKPLNPPSDEDRAGHPIAGVLLPQFTPGAEPLLEAIGLKQSVIGLCDRFGRFPVEPSDLTQLISLLDQVPRYQVLYGEGEDVMPTLSKLL